MKKFASTTLVGLAALVLTAADLSAQVCNGVAPFSNGKMRVGAGVRMPDGGTFLDGEFALGTKSGLFGGANISMFDPEASAADGSTFFGGFLGKTMMVDAKKTVEMCPQGFVMFGDDFNQFGGGVSFGKHFAQTSFDLIPFAGASIYRWDSGGFDDIDLDITGGAGFVFSKKWTVKPFLILPLTNDRDAVFGVMGYLNFGGTP